MKTKRLLILILLFSFAFTFKTQDCLAESNSLINITFPNGSETLYSGTDTLIRWDSELNNETLEIFYSIDNGENWERIVSAIIGESYKWKVPNTATKDPEKQCLIKVGTEDNNYSLLDSIKILGYGNLASVDFSDDGRFAISRSQTGFVVIWDVFTGKVIEKFIGEYENPNVVAWSNQNFAAFAAENKYVKIYDFENKEFFEIDSRLDGNLTLLEWNPDGQRLACADNLGNITILNASTKTLVMKMSSNKGSVQDISWDETGYKFVSGHGDGAVLLWDIKQGFPKRKELGVHSGLASAVSWARKGGLIASGGVDHRIIIHDTAGTTIKSLAAHTGRITSLSWNKEGTQLISGSDDHIVKRWTNAGELLRTYPLFSGNVLKVKFDDNGTQFFTGSSDNNIYQVNSLSNNIIKGLYGHLPGIKSIIPTNFDSNILACSGNSRQLYFWNIPKEEVEFVIKDSSSDMTCFDFSRFLERVAIGYENGKVKVYNSRNGNLIHILAGDDGHSGRVNDLSWSKISNQVTSAGSDFTIKIWETIDGNLMSTITCHEDSVLSIDWSSDGNFIASGGADKLVCISNANTFRLEKSLFDHSRPVVDVVWNRNDDTLLTSDIGGKGILWNTSNPLFPNKINELQNQAVNIEYKWHPKHNTFISPSDESGIALWSPKYALPKYDYELSIDNKTLDASAVNWNKQGNILIGATKHGTLHLLYLNGIPEFVQSDTSDNVWTITRPNVVSMDVFMGNVNIGADSIRNVYGFVSNLTNTRVRVDSFRIDGADKSQFSVDFGTTPYFLEPFEVKTISVRFSPVDIGEQSCLFTIYTQNDSIKQTLWGYGVRTNVKTYTIDFGDVNVGKDKDTVAIALGNIGLDTLNITRIELDCNSGVFKIPPQYLNPKILHPNDEYSIPITFSPDNFGYFSCYIKFYMDDDPTATISQLIGNGIYIEPVIFTVSAKSIYLACENSVLDSIEIQNWGRKQLELFDFNIVDDVNSAFEIITAPTNNLLDTGQIEKLYYSFKTSIPGESKARLLIENNSFNDSTTYIDLVGFKDSIGLQIIPEVVQLGDLCQGVQIEDYIDIKNIGLSENVFHIFTDSPITINTDSISLEPNETYNFFYQMNTPSNEGTYTYSLCVSELHCGKIDTIPIVFDVIIPELKFDSLSITSVFGSYKDSILVIENQNDYDITIDSIVNLDNKYIEFIDNIYNLQVTANSEISLALRYNALDTIQTNERFIAYLNPCNISQEFEIEVKPQPIDILISIDSISAKINDEVKIPLKLSLNSETSTLSDLSAISYSLCFNKHILYPVGRNKGTINEELRCVRYEDIPISDNQNEFSMGRFLIALGNNIGSTISIEDIEIKNAFLNPVVSHGYLSIEDICYDGGIRLVGRPENEIFIYSHYPNPSDIKVNLQFYNPYDDDVEISVFTEIGVKTKELYKEYTEKGNHSLEFEIKDLNSGTYLLEIRNSFMKKSRLLTIIK